MASLLPSVSALTGSPLNAADYLCNPSPPATQSEARAALTELLILAGHIDPSSDMDAPHCSDCVTSIFCAPQLKAITTLRATYFQNAPNFGAFSCTLNYAAQGPPIGGRAPPHIS